MQSMFKFGNFLMFYSPSSSLWPSYGGLSPELTTKSATPSSIFVNKAVMETALSSCENSGVDICSNGNLFDEEHADDFVLLNEDPSKLQFSPDRLNDSVGMFEMVFACSNCRVLLHYWISSKSISRSLRELSELVRFTYRGID